MLAFIVLQLQIGPSRAALQHLASASAEHQSVFGLATTSWEVVSHKTAANNELQSRQAYIFNATIPVGTVATVSLPSSSAPTFGINDTSDVLSLIVSSFGEGYDNELARVSKLKVPFEFS